MTEITDPETIQTTGYKKELIIGGGVLLAILAIIAGIILLIHNSQTKIDYQPVVACDLLTQAEAQKLLGAQAFNSNSDSPIVSGNTATSRCGYTDGNPDTNKVVVSAIIVRSGLNDKGVEQNKIEFINGKPTSGIEDVNALGDSAYFNQTLGQLNVLQGKKWIILSSGLGSSPEQNTLDDAVKLAKEIL